MRIKSNYSVKSIGEDKVLVSNTPDNLNMAKVMVLNHSATFLIEGSIDQHFSAESWAKMLQEEYGIDWERALVDSQQLIDNLLKEGAVEQTAN